MKVLQFFCLSLLLVPALYGMETGKQEQIKELQTAINDQKKALEEFSSNSEYKKLLENSCNQDEESCKALVSNIWNLSNNVGKDSKKNAEERKKHTQMFHAATTIARNVRLIYALENS